MKQTLTTAFTCALLLAFPFTKLFAQTEQEQRIHAAYMLAFGRDASAGDVAYWKGQGNLSLPQLILRHQQYLTQDVGTHNTTIDRAYQDALGRRPTAAELTYWKTGNDTYTTIMKNHVKWLGGSPADYEKVIKNSYQFVFGRQPSAGEINYWKGQGTVSYLMLVAFHQDWKRKSAAAQPESGSTVNLQNQGNVAVVSLSPTVAGEARSVTGLVASGGGNLIASGGGNLVASGGGNLIASGGGNLVASGGGN